MSTLITDVEGESSGKTIKTWVRERELRYELCALLNNALTAVEELKNSTKKLNTLEDEAQQAPAEAPLPGSAREAAERVTLLLAVEFLNPNFNRYTFVKYI